MYYLSDQSYLFLRKLCCPTLKTRNCQGHLLVTYFRLQFRFHLLLKYSHQDSQIRQILQINLFFYFLLFVCFNCSDLLISQIQTCLEDFIENLYFFHFSSAQYFVCSSQETSQYNACCVFVKYFNFFISDYQSTYLLKYNPQNFI